MLAKILCQVVLQTYPARVRIQEAPPHSIIKHLLHAPATVQKYSQHALTKLYDALVLLCLGRFRRVVGHGVLLWDGRYHQGRVQADQCCA